MNPSAAAYVPSPVIVRTLAERRATPPITAPLPSESPGTSPRPLTRAAVVAMTAAERLRNARRKEAYKRQPSAATSVPATSIQTLSSPMRASATDAAVPLQMSPPPVSQGAMFIRYSKQQLLSLRAAAIQQVMCGRVVEHPQLLKIPESFAPLLELPFAVEYVHTDAAVQLVEHRRRESPPSSSSSNSVAHSEHLAAEASARLFPCDVCSQGGPHPCPAIQQILQRVTRQVMTTTLGAALIQPALVVESLLRLALVFDAKQSSLRLRMLAQKSPRVVHLVEEYLCGEGYHLPLPPVTAHEDWVTLNGILKFDAIRNNETRVITDLSKHWKKRRTPFEQFIFFFAFRDARPVRPAKNIITSSVKPGMVAMLTGDVRAMILLHRLGFFIPPDYYWTVFPFLRQALGEGTLTYDAVRHLGLYLSSAQSADMYNPVERPTRV
ncbi:hypothetical protein LSCM1_02521 [Leishmania martiniquensis]|uniref:Uncharacterized protein n=1 Tax=Leishmania martiniquensis TaxID=1580590 RepID=A0A836G729_9TRYP|nr:hypothetical protein LSCM1_02521 [Leishmania martiniquensis]